MAEAWRYRDSRTGWTKFVLTRDRPPASVTLRVYPSGGYWSAAVYRGALVAPSALVPGTRSRHESREAAQRKLLAWVRMKKKETPDG